MALLAPSLLGGSLVQAASYTYTVKGRLTTPSEQRINLDSSANSNKSKWEGDSKQQPNDQPSKNRLAGDLFAGTITWDTETNNGAGGWSRWTIQIASSKALSFDDNETPEELDQKRLSSKASPTNLFTFSSENNRTFMSARGSAEVDPTQDASAGIFSSPLGHSDRPGPMGISPKPSDKDVLGSPSDNGPPRPNFFTCTVGGYDCTQHKGPIIPSLFSVYQITSEMQPFAWISSDDGRVTLLEKLKADLSETSSKITEMLADSDDRAAVSEAVYEAALKRAKVFLKKAEELDDAAKKTIEDNLVAGFRELKVSNINPEDLPRVVNQTLDSAFVGRESHFNYLRIPLAGKDLLSLSTPESYTYDDYRSLGYGWSRLPGDPAAQGDGASGAFCVSSDVDPPAPGTCPFRLNQQEAQPEETANKVVEDDAMLVDLMESKRSVISSSKKKEAVDSEEANADESSVDLIVDMRSASENAFQKGWESYVSSFSITLTTCTKDMGTLMQCDPGVPPSGGGGSNGTSTAPAPLGVFGVGAAFGWARRLRRQRRATS